MITPYETPRAFCEAVHAVAASSHGRLVARPFNRFEPNRTSWWLVPSTAQPHLKFGRLYFVLDQFDPASILCGLHVHKGLDASLAPVFSSKRGRALLMDESWAWQKFASDMAAGIMERELTTVLAKTPSPSLFIDVDGGYVTEPSEFDPYSETRIKSDFYRFEAADGGRLAVGRSDRKAYVLKLHQAETVTALGKLLADELGKDQWLWLSVFVCARFRIKPLADGNSHDAEWDARKSWEGFLSLLAPWIR